MVTIEQELSTLTNNFTDKAPAVRCKTIEEKQEALKIFRQHYEVVEVSDGRKPGEKEMSWVIACSNPKDMNESLLEEGGDMDMELADFDDPDDDLDLEDENYDSIDDISEIDKANKITLLKKKAADLAEKWRETYKEISILASDLDLTAVHDEELNIELKKTNGKDADIEGDLDEIDKEISDLEDEAEDIDDSFGPSEYDSRAAALQDEPETAYEESLQQPSDATLVESTSLISNDPNELPIRADEIDDDF